jgi:hypothetical protein
VTHENGAHCSVLSPPIDNFVQFISNLDVDVINWRDASEYHLDVLRIKNRSTRLIGSLDFFFEDLHDIPLVPVEKQMQQQVVSVESNVTNTNYRYTHKTTLKKEFWRKNTCR